MRSPLPDRGQMPRTTLLLRLLGIAVATGISFAGCAGTVGREVSVVAGEADGKRMYFEPGEIRVRAGERVTFIIRNDGKLDHEFESDEAGIEEVLIPSGRTRRATWTAPKQPGRYPVYCDIAGHREAGMELVLVVEPAP